MTFDISSFAKQMITLLPDEEKSCQEAVDLISEVTTDDNTDEIATKIFEQIGNERALSKIALIFSRTSPESLNSPTLSKIKNACLLNLIPDFHVEYAEEKFVVANEKKEIWALVILMLQEGRGFEVLQNLSKFKLKALPLIERLELCKLIVKHGGADQLSIYFEQFELGSLPIDEQLELYELITSHGGGDFLARDFKKLGLDNLSLDKRLTLFKLIATHGGGLILAMSFEDFELETLSDNERLELCELVVSHGGASAVTLQFEKFGLGGLSDDRRLTLCKFIALHGGGRSLVNHFENFGLGGLPAEERLALCEFIALHGGGGALAEKFEKFNLSDLPLDKRLELCKLIASHSGASRLAFSFEKFGLDGPNFVKERLELRKLIASSGYGNVLVDNMGALKLDIEEAVSLIQSLFRSKAYMELLFRHANDTVEWQVYLEAWRLLHFGKDLSSRLTAVVKGDLADLVKVFGRKEELPLQEVLSILRGFIVKHPKLSLLLPLTEQIEKSKAEYQPALLDWVTYAAGVLYDQKEEEVSTIESSGMIKFLFEHNKPENRYIFMRLLSSMAKEGVPLPNVEGRHSNKYFEVFTPLLLRPLRQLGLENDTYEALNEEIAKKDFRQIKNFDQLIQFFQCMTIQVPLNEKEINFLALRALEWLKSMPNGLVKRSNQQTSFKNGLRNFTALTSIFNIFKKAEYSDVLTGTGEDHVNFFAARFKDKFAIGKLEDVDRKYHETFGTSRDPMAIFTYLGSVEKLGEGDRNLVKEAFTKYVVAVLEGKFPAVRYEYDQTAESHLKQVFQKPEIREGWIAKAAPMQFSLQSSKEPKAIDYKKFFRTKILDDKHIHPTEVPRLAAFLNGEKTKEQSDSEEPLEQLQDLAIQLIKGEIEIGDFLKAVDEFKHDLPEVFRNDLPALTLQKGGGEYQIEENDDPYDLLLIGTEIKGSCQSIYGIPEFNKCLVSYLMNGEIKAIAVKEGNKLVARSVMRLLWDPVKGPIILLERVYSNISDKQIDAQILAWAKNKAEQLNVPLVSREVGEQSTPYTGEVNFLGGGIAPFVYSDAGGGVKNGPFNIAESYLQFLPETR